MSRTALDVVVLGLSITSSWGNGHATTYRGLLRELSARGHRVCFLERDLPWYAENRDLPHPPFCETHVYSSLNELFTDHAGTIQDADAVMLGSYVPEGAAVGEWVTKRARGATVFYDIDTPVTLAKLRQNTAEYITPELVSRYDMYLSFTGGPTLDLIQRVFGARRAEPLYCSVDPELYYPEEASARWALGYLGTYSVDRQAALAELVLEPARRCPALRFAVAGSQYPEEIAWPRNVDRVIHLSPQHHRAFYNAQRYALNVTRVAMIRAGYSPSVRLFESAACGTPVISDFWPGLDGFFRVGEEVLVARSASDIVAALESGSEAARREMGSRARERVLQSHTAAHRAAELEEYLLDIVGTSAAPAAADAGEVRVGSIQ